MLNIINSKPSRLAFITLFNNGVCIRCILRFFRIEVYEEYRDKSKYIELLGQISDQELLPESLLHSYDFLRGIVKSEQKCRLCLGLLQECDQPAYVKHIGDLIRSSKFEFDKFKFAIKVPNSTLLRFAQAIQFVKHKLAESNVELPPRIINWRDNHLEVKTPLKWILAPLLSKEIESQSTVEDDSLQINLNFDNDQDQNLIFNRFHGILKSMASQKLERKLEKVQKKMKADKFDNLQKKVEHIEASAANLNKILNIDPIFLFKSLLKEQFSPKVEHETKLKIDIRCNSIFLFGYYVKYSRYLSQTPWIVNNVKLTDSSIQEQLEKILLKYFYPEELCLSEFVKFHSGGREDIDVRMLSTGRPFAIEFCSPRFCRILPEQVQDLMNEINTSKYIKINSLKFSDDKCLEVLKKSEIQKIKAYSCFVHFQQPYTKEHVDKLNSIRQLVLDQKTPLRVLHRRTLMVRNKIIHAVKVLPIDENNMVVNVLASAGTYIKQFVHGDLERTTPNIGSLIGNQADIFQLDVLKIYEKMDEHVLVDFYNSAVNFLQI